MVMLLLVAAMAILMEYSLSKVILCIQNKKCKSPSTPYTKSKQVGTVYTGGDRVAITSAEETGTFSAEACQRRTSSLCVPRMVWLPPL